MRTIIELPADQIEALDRLCDLDLISRAEAIRRAVGEHLARRHAAESRAAYGIWRDRGIDALKYEDAIRHEWRR